MSLESFLIDTIDKLFDNPDRRPKREIAKFVGKNGSCGLKNGHDYIVSLVKDGDGFRINVYSNGIGVPYGTLSAVQKNWDFRK